MNKQVYDTAQVSRSQQLSYWNDLVCNVFTGLDCQKKDRGEAYKGILNYCDLTQLEISVVECDASDVIHSKSHVSKGSDDDFLMHIQLEGRSQNQQLSHSAELISGDFAICQSSIPYRLTFEHPIKMMVVKIPRSLLQKYIPQPDLIIGLKVEGSLGLSQMLISHLKELWRYREQFDKLSHQVAVSDTVLSLLSMIYATAFPDKVNANQSSVKHALLLRLQAYINRSLSDPGLSPSKVAMANNVSTRYLRTLFSEESLTCGQYILAKRLEAAAEELSHPCSQTVQITQLAYKWGFNNASHFSTAFKDKNGLSPKDFRSNSFQRK